ncbi:hypothetical protein ScPMuIL_014837 [Solemya velum]
MEVILNELFVDRKWPEIIAILDSIPLKVLRCNPDLLAWYDFTLCCEIHDLISPSRSNLSDVNLANCLRCFKCPLAQTRTLLTIFNNLSVDHALELFEMCCFYNIPTDLQQAVQEKIEILKIYQKITDSVKNLQIKLSLQTNEFISLGVRDASPDFYGSLDNLTDWRTLVKASVTSPDEVLAVLLKTGDFDTIKAWAKLHPPSDDKQLEIQQRHLIALLDQNPPNTTKAFLLLEELHQQKDGNCLLICQHLLETLTNQREVLFVVSYMVNQIAEGLTDDRLDDLRLTQIGAKMLLCLPESARSEYSHLVTTPKLLLEQLLMNMNADLAGQAFEKVKRDYDNIRDVARRFSVSTFNELVAHYASKALEFSVIQGSDKSGMSVICQQTLDQEVNKRIFPLILISVSPSARSPTPVLAVDNSPQTRPSSYTGSKGAGSSVGGDRFVMPADPPTKDKWVPDSAVSVCMVCRLERFSMFNRRHHCRRCGRLVCAGCSNHTSQIRGVSARTCDDCYKQIFKPSEQPEKDRELYQQRKDGSGVSPSPLSATPITGFSPQRKVSVSEVIRHTHSEWKLTTDELYNTTVREEFYFEQEIVTFLKVSDKLASFVTYCCLLSPSTSLCLSILKHHSEVQDFSQQSLCPSILTSQLKSGQRVHHAEFSVRISTGPQSRYRLGAQPEVGLFTNHEPKSLHLRPGSSVLRGYSDSQRSASLCPLELNEFRLGAVAIFTHVAREMVQHSRYDHVKHLLDKMSAAGMGDDESVDEIVGACLLVIADRNSEVKETENLIKLLRNDSNKINAYILCGKLRSAYLLAVKGERVEDVQRIVGAAQRMGQTAVKNICNKWLQQRKK